MALGAHAVLNGGVPGGHLGVSGYPHGTQFPERHSVQFPVHRVGVVLRGAGQQAYPMSPQLPTGGGGLTAWHVQTGGRPFACGEHVRTLGGGHGFTSASFSAFEFSSGALAEHAAARPKRTGRAAMQ